MDKYLRGRRFYGKFYDLILMEDKKKMPDVAKADIIGCTAKEYSKLKNGYYNNKRHIPYWLGIKILRWADGKLDWNDLPGWDWREKIQTRRILKQTLLDELYMFILYSRPKFTRTMALFFLRQANGTLAWEDIPGYDWRDPSFAREFDVVRAKQWRKEHDRYWEEKEKQE